MTQSPQETSNTPATTGPDTPHTDLVTNTVTPLPTYLMLFKQELRRSWKWVLGAHLILICLLGVALHLPTSAGFFGFLGLAEFFVFAKIGSNALERQNTLQRQQRVGRMLIATSDLAQRDDLKRLSAFDSFRVRLQVIARDNKRGLWIVALIPLIGGAATLPYHGIIDALVVAACLLVLCGAAIMIMLGWELLVPPVEAREEISVQLRLAQKRRATDTFDGALSLEHDQLTTQGALTPTTHEGALSPVDDAPD